MHTVLTPKQMSEVDRYMIEEMKIPSLILMENAAKGVVDVIQELEECGPCIAHIYCGTGNNGGDGLAVARQLWMHGYEVFIKILGERSSLTKDAAENFAMFEKWPDRYRFLSTKEELLEWEIPEAELIVDAIFGTGLSRPLEGVQKSAVRMINESAAFVVACDIPSGVNAETGQILGDAVCADVTVTFQYPKIGHYLFPGRMQAGALEVVPIGVDDGCDILREVLIKAYDSSGDGIALGRRQEDANKGDYGRALLVAGSSGMAGAAVLGARAASSVGAGLVTVASVDEVVSVVQNNVPHATCRVVANEEGMLIRHSIFDIDRIVKDKSALGIGPGLGLSNDIRAVVANIVENHSLTKVIDADAINALIGVTDILANKKGDIILTPHAKEFAGLLETTVEYVLANSLKLAQEFARKYGVVLVLKGATTIIADSKGRVALVCAGSPGMAKGGSGDVLTGVITGLVAQGKRAYEAALLGVYLSAVAGEIAAEEFGEYSMTPSDTVDMMGDAIQTILSDSIWASTVKKEQLYKEPKSERIKEEEKMDVKEIEELVEETKKEIVHQKNDDNNPTKRRIG